MKIKCPACRKRNWKRLISFHPTAKTYTFYQCVGCGLIMINPFPQLRHTRKLYTFADADIHKQTTSTLMNLFYRLPLGKRLLDFYTKSVYTNRHHLITSLVHTGTLLDVGCAEGQFLSQFDKNCWTLAGVEINPSLAKSAPAALNIHVGNIETFASHRKFSVITLWHVFEHLNNPEYIIKKLHRLMAEDGYLVIEVPQAHGLGRVLFGKYWRLWLIPQHLYFWTAPSLAQLLTRHGFKVQLISYRGFISSCNASLVLWLKKHGLSICLAIFLSVILFLFFLITHLIIPTTRDNLLIVARKNE